MKRKDELLRPKSFAETKEELQKLQELYDATLTKLQEVTSDRARDNESYDRTIAALCNLPVEQLERELEERTRRDAKTLSAVVPKVIKTKKRKAFE